MPRKKVLDIVVNREWCKRCGICSSFCPTEVFDTEADGTVIVARPDACIACELCERLCPDLAIDIELAEAVS